MTSIYERILIACVALAAALLSASPAHAEQEATVQWNDAKFRRTNWIEGATSVTFVGATFVIQVLPYPDHASWRDPILFDSAARSFFKGDPNTQAAASSLSDYLFYGMFAAPFVVDDAVVALGVHRNRDVALQMTMMDLQSFGIAGVITLSTEHLVGRSRPPFTGCSALATGPNDTDPTHCQSRDDYRSFFAGHPTATFTSAGLTCAHHQHLPLYGGGVPDLLTCIGMIGLATTTSVLRLVADRHWASDVIVGAAVGVASGYFLPSILHYGMFGAKKTDTIVKTSFGYVAPTPMVFTKGGGLGLSGVF